MFVKMSETFCPSYFPENEVRPGMILESPYKLNDKDHKREDIRITDLDRLSG